MMTNQLQVFNNEDFGEIRGVMIDGVPYFVGKDVAEALGYTNPRKAVRDHVDVEDKLEEQIIPPGQNQRRSVILINESGLYSLILTSKLPKAKQFKRWVTSEVLPSIRKMGSYSLPPRVDDVAKVILSPEYVMQLCQSIINERAENARLKDTVNVQAIQIAELTPKANFYDLILQSKSAVPISVIAKDYGISPKRMNKLLHKLKIQYKIGDIWLLYQKYAQCGYTVTQTFPLENGSSKIHTYWTQKGRLFLYEKLKQHGILPTRESEAYLPVIYDCEDFYRV